MKPEDDLDTASRVGLATVDLDYERFRKLARNPNLSPHERIGFPDAYREGYEPAILQDIRSKLPMLEQPGKVIVDVGPGCANLPRMIIQLCEMNGNKLVLADSPEMLDQLPAPPCVVKVPGQYPANAEAIRAACGRPADALICYSVLHYLYVDTNLFDVVDVTLGLLARRGAALFGDIPNLSKRKRFFSSPTGVEFHKNFMKTEEAPRVDFNRPEPGKIDDAVVAGFMQRAQLAGCDAYLLPQPDALPMANRRDDILIRKP